MPDTPVDPTSPRSYPSDMESRVAVLERIARTTNATLERMERRLDLLGAEFRSSVAEERADFRWLLGIMLAGFAGRLGVMAHGFHWL
ncbi:MAG: hypothetical protein ABI224_09040 [Acetobacteraceae bacterium]